MDSVPGIGDRFAEHVIGSFIAICLFGVMSAQATHYYETFHDDKWQLKLLVSDYTNAFFHADSDFVPFSTKVATIW